MITIDPPASPHPHLTPFSRVNLTRFLNRARTALNLTGNVDVLLTTDAELKRLNRTFRGKNRPTDVLSFPAGPAPISTLPPAHQHTGDLAISLDTAARQAHSFGHPIETEVRILLLHGLLHLAGLDHETDAGQMAARESELRSKFRLPTSLITRTLNRIAPGQQSVIPTEAKRRKGNPFSPHAPRPSKNTLQLRSAPKLTLDSKSRKRGPH